jgi:hypothetical protein
MEKLESDLGKFQNAREKTAAEEAEMIRAVDEYLNKQISKDEGPEQVLKRYFEKYKDILESPLVEPLKTQARMNQLKRIIYLHEIKQSEKEKAGDMQKAA